MKPKAGAGQATRDGPAWATGHLCITRTGLGWRGRGGRGFKWGRHLWARTGVVVSELNSRQNWSSPFQM